VLGEDPLALAVEPQCCASFSGSRRDVVLSAELQKTDALIPLPPQLEAGDEASPVQYDFVQDKPDKFIEDLTFLAAQICSAPLAVLSIVRADNIRHISRSDVCEMHGEDFLIGLGAGEDGSWCVISDTMEDARVKDFVQGR
jgi:hypothetical protein